MTSAPPQNRAMQLIHSVSLCLYTLFFIVNPLSPVFAGQPSFACDLETSPKLAAFTFCDSSAEIDDRVSDLVGRLTLEEKVQFLGDTQGSVDRLGIPKYEWWSEALHGVSDTGRGVNFARGPIYGATSFPQVILTAASYNKSLFEAIGKVVSTEARAMYNNGLAGLTFWAPNINILRDPRWGRAQETPGEDPTLSSDYAQMYVKGLQQRDDGDTKRLKVAACCKHYTAYDLDNWKTINRFTFDAEVTQQDLEDTFQPPFKSCVLDGNVASVMCSYNQVNGKPTCADRDFLYGVVRGEWHLNGYIVSDCDSISVFNNYQGFTKTLEEAAAVALNAGLDHNCGDSLQKHAVAAVKSGLVNISEIDRAVSNNLATLMRLGFFDGNPAKHLYGNLGPSDVCTEANQKLAREAARQGIVLLKNDFNTLPLSPTTIKSLALIGPNANATETMIGNYAGKPCKYTSPLDGIGLIVPTMYVPGCGDVPCNTVQLEDAKKAASLADATILVMGTSLSIENEGLDRVNLTLPGQQQLLVTEVAKVSRGPVILVVMSGGPTDIQFAQESGNVKSILWVGYPGQAGGAALADVIFGYFCPHGRLPMSWYPQSYADKIPMTNMNMRPNTSTGYPGRTYRFYTGPTIYEFGYGMSYTKFEHQLVQAPEKVSLSLEEGHVCLSSSCKSIDVVDEQHCEKMAFEVHLRVKNVGEMSGGHTVLLFSSPPPVHRAPQKHLMAFDKVFLDPQNEETVRFKVDVCKDLSLVDELGKKKIALGEHLIHVGDLNFTLSVMT